MSDEEELLEACTYPIPIFSDKFVASGKRAKVLLDQNKFKEALLEANNAVVNQHKEYILYPRHSENCSKYPSFTCLAADLEYLAYRASENNELMIDILSQAISLKIDKNRIGLLVKRAQAYFVSKRYPEAIVDAEEVMSIDMMLPIADLIKCNALDKMKNVRGALAALKLFLQKLDWYKEPTYDFSLIDINECGDDKQSLGVSNLNKNGIFLGRKIYEAEGRSVFLGTCGTGNHKETVAIKFLRVNDGNVYVRTIREMAAKDFKHPNVISYRSTFIHENSVCIVMDYCPDTLDKYLTNNPEISKDKITEIMYELLLGLEYLHERGALHRDLKPNNIMMTEKGQVKIVDFGLARFFIDYSKPLTPKLGTKFYQAPEILLGSEEYTSAIDIWSLGCVFLTMINPNIRVRDFGDETQIFKVFGVPKWPGVESLSGYRKLLKRSRAETEPKDFEDHFRLDRADPAVLLVKRMLTLNPSERISAKDALAEFFDISE